MPSTGLSKPIDLLKQHSRHMKKKETEQVRIPKALKRKLKIEAARTGKTIGELIEQKITNGTK